MEHNHCTGAAMVGLIRRHIVFLGALLWLSVWGVAHVWPPSWWLAVRHVIAFDGPEDAPVVMTVDRKISRPFVANWSVLVRRWSGSGWVVYCAANGGGEYRPDAGLPDPLTLEWWTDGRCSTPSPGQYLISTVWTINGGVLPDKIVRVDSNPFNIVAATEARRP